jgi:acyl-CoA synthetase (AMP-forming)/AMP-acid ligase II/surface polysaccharide O-acyltransferase-like enzyme
MSLRDRLHVTAVRKQNSIDYLDAVFDCFEAGQVVLPVREFEDALPAGITVERRRPTTAGNGWYTRAVTPGSGTSPAQIILSSGTTGTPKAVVLSHGALADVAHRLIEVTRLDHSVREYVGIPVTFSFGFGRVRAIAAVGGAAFLPARGFRIDEIAEMLGAGEINSLSAVPTLLRLILSDPRKIQAVGENLRWLEIGSQSMSAGEKAAVRGLFPRAKIVQHYGLTEASRSTFLTIDDDTAHFDSVGRPNGSVEVRITAEGHIAIRGPHLASGILTSDGLQSLVDPHGWLVTSDLGTINDGHLHFQGRADDLINIGGVKVPAEAFERSLLSRSNHFGDVAVGAIDDALLGQKALIATTAAADLASDSGLRQATQLTAEEFRISEDGYHLAEVLAIPRTETNKVQRWALVSKIRDAAPSAQIGQPPGGVADVFSRIFGNAAKDFSRSFVDLGGDSLSYVRTSLELETILPLLPGNWEEMSIAELQALEQTGNAPKDHARTSQPKLLLNLDTLRGLACLMIVGLHVIGADPTDGLQLEANSWWHRSMDYLEFIRLPLFTCLAGIFYAILPVARLGWPAFMGRKLRQFLPPLIFATLVFWCLRRWVYGVEEDILIAFVDGYLHLWYLDALLAIFAVASAVDVTSRGRSLPMIMAALVAASLYLAVPSFELLHLRNALFLFPFFVFGVVLYRHNWLISSRLVLPVAVPLILAYPIALTILGAALPGTALDAVLTWLGGSAAIVALLRFAPRIGILEVISIFSFTIYLWHPAASAMVRNLMDALGGSPTWVAVLLGTIAGVVLPMGVHRLAERLPVLGNLLKG